MASAFGFAKVCGHANHHEGRMSDNRYSYEGREDLTPRDLFFWVAVGEIHARFGFDDLVGRR
ncbi:hypothetical protein [Burkholderia sp. IMCC1007]|uniref:hypothetical protein n=1 Tax=Burkholderia sp. IMCC1007 TaxID=3004104 RepID=UPI0022B44826|nr:hypothetical protein [Burkholderia sp. IMCC1007]